jgi:TetR/AcrR family transcriptional regulator, repressor for uid operon
MARKRDPEREAQRRAEILQAAARAFIRDGLRGTSIASICKEAGISPGHLYYYFSSKEALIEAMAEADLAAIRGYAQRLQTLDDLLDAAVASSEFMALPFDEPGKLLEGALAFDLHAEATRNPRIHAIVERHYRDISALFGERLAAAQKAGGVAAGHDPVRLARLVGAVREGLLVMSAIGPDMVDSEMRKVARRMLESAARS